MWTLSSEELGDIRIPPHGLRRFLVDLQSPRCMYAIVTTLPSGQVIGCLRHDVVRKCLMVEVAWVLPSWRRQGVATAMWKHAQEYHQTQRSEAMAVTRAGLAFLRSISATLGPDLGLVEGI